MPKVVDHEARRRELATAALRVIADGGLAGATTREIAQAAGVSSSSLSHYFPDKRAILRAAVRAAYERAAQRVALALETTSGFAALRAVLLEALPLDEERRFGEQIEVAFWSQAVGDDELAAEQYAGYTAYCALVTRVLRDAQSSGEISPDVDAPTTAAWLVALVDGLGAEGVLYPSAFRPEHTIGVFDAALAMLRTHADG